MPNIKNIIIFTAIAVVLILIYVFFIKKPPESDTGLISSSESIVVENTMVEGANSLVAAEFLTLLLSVKNIKLDDAIFSNTAFNSLYDSSIILTPDGNEGRLNPFAPLGIDNVVLPLDISNIDTTTPLTP